ncbi:ArsR/SmtB family transcription factor [Stutzerimonas sp. NM35]
MAAYEQGGEMICQIQPVAVAGYAGAFKALADTSRLRIFWLLAHINERICVAEAMKVLGTSHYNASRHLTILKKAQLVVAQREGTRVFYTLNKAGNGFVLQLLAAVREIPAVGFEIEVERCKQLLALR